MLLEQLKPECRSLIAIVISTLFALHLIRRAVRAGQVVQPWWVRGGYRKL
jgi:hypothetical protein